MTDVYEISVYKVLVTELIDHDATHADLKLDQLLREVPHVGEAPGEIPKQISDVFSIQFVWGVLPSWEDIRSLCDLIAPEIDISKLFDLSSTGAKHGHVSYRYGLRSLVCYYGRHFITFVKIDESNKWRLLDDATMTEVGCDEQLLAYYRTPTTRLERPHASCPIAVVTQVGSFEQMATKVKKVPWRPILASYAVLETEGSTESPQPTLGRQEVRATVAWFCHLHIRPMMTMPLFMPTLSFTSDHSWTLCLSAQRRTPTPRQGWTTRSR